MTKVHIAGIGMTALGRFPDRSVKTLTAEAVALALGDAGCQVADIEAAWFANTRQGMMEGQNVIRGQVALRDCGLTGLPIFNVENACASGSTGVALAATYIQAGAADVVLVVGAEKMFFPGRGADMMRAFEGGADIHALDQTRAAFAGMGEHLIPPDAPPPPPHSVMMDFYAGLARLHMGRYGTTRRQIAAAAAKNHRHSTMNSLAQYQGDMTIDDVLNDAPIVWPFTRAMCAPISDGAAAAVLCSDRGLRRLGANRAVEILGLGVSSSSVRPADDFDRHCGRIAADRAYEASGVGPADIGVVELHDASAFAEILQIENLGLCVRGEGGVFTEAGETALGGRVPVNPSGGLVSKGHPIAATGVMQLHELVTQLRGEAGPRQVPDLRVAVAENGGGFLGFEEAACVVTVLGR